MNFGGKQLEIPAYCENILFVWREGPIHRRANIKYTDEMGSFSAAWWVHLLSAVTTQDPALLQLRYILGLHSKFPVREIDPGKIVLEFHIVQFFCMNRI